jgi:geranylgeranyl pyrophosphate synthase
MQFEAEFKKILSKLNINKDLGKLINYSLFPTGKLFRPRLCMSIADDLKIKNDSLIYYAFALEVHHTYTLIHDDLPCMDDDDERRGRPSLHKKFNEWKALLAGDALMNLSYELISYIETDHTRGLLKNFSQFTGINGLIYGQYLDLKGADKSFEQTLELHRLKTARLIQLSIIGPLISEDYQDIDQFSSFGEKLGLYFQIQDDLSELSPNLNKSSHEQNINLFLNHAPQKVIMRFWQLKKEVNDFLKDKNLKKTNEVFSTYQESMSKLINQNKDYIEREFQISLDRL